MDSSCSVNICNSSRKTLGTIIEEAEQIAEHGFPSALEEEYPLILGSNLSAVSTPTSHLASYSGDDHQTSPMPSCSSSIQAYLDVTPLPMSPEEGNSIGYLEDYDILREADIGKNRIKRVGFDDFELDQQEQTTMISRLEDVAYEKNIQDGTMSDGDIITLQLFTINGLQQARRRDGRKFSRLTETLDTLMEENRVLQDINREHMEQRLHILNTVVRRRGQELKEHGEFLMHLAEQNTAPGQFFADT